MPYKSKLTRQRLAQLFLDIKSRRFSDVDLSKMYKLERTSILYYRNKLGIGVTREEKIRFFRAKRNSASKSMKRPTYLRRDEKNHALGTEITHPKTKYEYLIHESDGIENQGKDYKEYLHEHEQKRHSIFNKISQRTRGTTSAA